MLIVNTPICPKCGQGFLTRRFSTLDYIGMALFLLLLFPLSIWIYQNPRAMLCQHCGVELQEKPV